MAAHDVQFTAKECKPVKKFLFLKGKTPKEIYDEIRGKKSLLFDRNWVS
jgi:hypothetical protein